MPVDPLILALDAARHLHANGDHQAVVEWLVAALDGPRADAPAADVGEAHTLLAHAHFALGRFDASLRHARLALDAWRRAGDSAGECRALRLRTFALTEAGLHEEALIAAREAFDVAEAQGLALEALQLLVLVGAIHTRLGDADTAESLLLQAVSRARERSQPGLLLQALTTLLNALLGAHRAAIAAGETERAAAAAQRMGTQVTRLLRMTRDEPNALRRAVNLGNAGEALGACGREDEAAQALDESLRLSREHGFGIVEIATLMRLGRLRLRQGALDGVAAAVGGLALLLERTPHPDAADDLLDLQADLARARGDDALAQRHADAARQSRATRRRALQALRDGLDLDGDAALVPRVHELELRAAG